MENERSTDRLARYIMYLAVAAAICAFCWYFRSAIVYILLAAVISLMGRPIKTILGKIRIKGKSAPDWLLAIVTLVLIMAAFIGIVTQIIPVISSIVQNVALNMQVG